MKITAEDRIKGCYFGGAIGDALGWPVEFMTRDQIGDSYGPGGIKELQLNHRGKAEISDDTQMTLFVAEGLTNAKRLKWPITQTVREAIIKWGEATQNDQNFEYSHARAMDQLLDFEELYARRGPGRTCISAIKNGAWGTPDEQINESKGCGGVMRAAAAGLLEKPVRAFYHGTLQAAMTHGHPSGHFAAGAFAMIISYLMGGLNTRQAAESILSYMISLKEPGMAEVIHSLSRALGINGKEQGYEGLRFLGEGWVAEEALAIAVFCALEHQDSYEDGIRLAVNHSGDSDSTGAMAGQLLGAHLGYEKIPTRWTEVIEARSAIEMISRKTIEVTSWREAEG